MKPGPESSPRTPPPNGEELCISCGHPRRTHAGGACGCFESVPHGTRGYATTLCECESFLAADSSSGRTPEVSTEMAGVIANFRGAAMMFWTGDVNDPEDERRKADYRAKDYALREAVARLESRLGEAERDSKRLDWLDDRRNWIRVGPASSMVGVPKGWGYWGPGKSQDTVGQRCTDLREAIDSAMGERTDA